MCIRDRFMHGLPTLAVVLVLPGALPHLPAAGEEHASLAARGHDLVLTERKGGGVSKGAYRPSPVPGAVGLGAVLDQEEVSLPAEVQDGIHVTGPAGQMDNNDRPGLRRERCRDCLL